MNKRKHSSGRIVFLLDVDNTLLDKDGVQADLRRHLIGNVGRKRAKEYWRMLDPRKIANWIWADVKKQKN